MREKVKEKYPKNTKGIYVEMLQKIKFFSLYVLHFPNILYQFLKQTFYFRVALDLQRYYKDAVGRVPYAHRQFHLLLISYISTLRLLH